MSVNKVAHRASLTGDWDIVHQFYTAHEKAFAVNASGDTILHLLILNHHTCIVCKLFQHFPLTINCHLLAQNHKGNTVLHEAVMNSSMEIVKQLVEKEERLVSIRNSLGETPLYWAAIYGKKEILSFLRKKIRDENVLIRSDFSTILHAAVAGEFYGLAIEINEWHPSLAGAHDKQGITALHHIAQSPASYRSGTVYTYQHIGASSPFIPMDIFAILIYMCLPSYDNYPTKKTEISGVVRFIRRCPWIKIIDDAKRKHACVLELAKQLITSHKSSEMPDEMVIKECLFLASKHGIIEVVEKISQEFPEMMESINEDKKNIMHLVVEHRSEQVFHFLLKSKNFPIAKMVAMVDKDGNTPLHLAAKLGKKPLYIQGDFQRMQWEVLWFKQVDRLFPQHLRHLRNFTGHTAEELFSVTHESLQKSADEWVKCMSNMLTLISTLIAAINFQAAFTVPGGLDQNKGYPIFLHRKYFIQYLFFLSLALFASLLSLGAALSAHLSAFNIRDYYLSLPVKLLVGCLGFFFSVIATIWAYALGIYLESSPRTDVLQMVFGHAGVWGGNLLSAIVLLDITYPFIRSVVNAFKHSLSYPGTGL